MTIAIMEILNKSADEKKITGENACRKAHCTGKDTQGKKCADPGSCIYIKKCPVYTGQAEITSKKQRKDEL